MINDPLYMDSGKYVCVAENRAGKAEIAHFVSVEPNMLHRAGSPVRSIAPAVVEEAAPTVESVETPVEAEKETKVETEKPKSADKKPAAKKGAKGKKGKDDKQVALPPNPKNNLYFIAHLSDRTVAAGSKLRLSCYVQGPDAQFKWFKDDCTLPFGPKCKQVSKENGFAAIEMAAITTEQAGVYKCTAKNSAGETSTSSKVTVFENINVDILPVTITRAIVGKFACSLFFLQIFNYICLNLCIFFSVLITICIFFMFVSLEVCTILFIHAN